MTADDYFRLRTGGPGYVDFHYIENDDYIFTSMDSICNKLNEQEEKIRKLQKEKVLLKQQQEKLYDYFRKCFDNVSEEGFRETWDVILNG